MEIGRQITQPEGYKAFIPHPFPPKAGDLGLSPETVILAEDANRLLGKLDGITQVIPDLDFFIFMYVRKEAALSSQIEGTRATMVNALEADAELERELPPDVDDIHHYIEAMNYGLHRLQELPISRRLICEVHEVLMKEGRATHFASPGEFRKTQNWVGGSSIKTARYVPPPVHEMNKALSDFEKFLNSKTAIFSPLTKAGLAHAQFETIHPFLDGNGRTGRLLVTFFLCQQEILERPVLYLSAYLKKHRDTYFDLLDAYHNKGSIDEWLRFFFEGIVEVSNEAIVLARKLTELRDEDHTLVQSLGRSAEKASRVLKEIYKLPIVNVNKIEKWTSLNRANANKLVKKLEDVGILVQRNDGDYARIFHHARYLKLFSDPD